MDINDPHPATKFLRDAARHLSAGQAEAAVRACQEAIKRFPNHPQSHYALAVALNGAGRLDDAIQSYQTTVRLKPDFFEAWTNLGGAMARRGRLDEAVEAYTRALRIRPNVAEMHANLSNALRDTGRLAEAEAAAKQALALKPDSPHAHVCYAAVLASNGQYERAIEAYHEAIRLAPDLPGGHFNLAFSELVLGNWQRGWAEYEWRRRFPGAVPPRKFPTPDWDGRPLNGKTILLFSEQGFGDSIHFVRYAPLVAEMGGRIIVECLAPLARLFRGIPKIDQVIVAGRLLPAFDTQSALPSLPGLFHTTPQTVPVQVPYLTAEPGTIEAWRERINPSPEMRQIGLAWSGSSENRNDRNRSIPPETFSRLSGAKNVRFHNLQIAPPPAIAGIQLADWSAHLTDFAETAGLIANLDLIITVDTAVAHLAGAMGKAAWVLLPTVPDWRWLLDRSDTPWYPTMRLFRQKTAGDWDEVLAHVAEELG
jgi:tetratricopeptide (TPR) repeat protein